MPRVAHVFTGLTALTLAACSGEPSPPPPDLASEDEGAAIDRAAEMLDERRGGAPMTEHSQEDPVP